MLTSLCRSSSRAIFVNVRAEGRLFFSGTTTANPETVKEEEEASHQIPITEALRHAQASEMFRRSYLFGQRAQNRVSVSDIDDLMIANRSRPSLLLGVLQFSGATLGMVSRVLPKDCSNNLNQVVQEATIQQFNDIIRDLQHQSDCEDTKETIKYHRDLEATDVTASQAKTNTTNETSGIDTVTIAATTALYNILKLSKTL